MTNILLADTTRKQIARYLESPTTPLLITGVAGTGKYYLAQEVASRLLNTGIGKLDKQPYLIEITAEEGSISIDVIRELRKSLIRKVPGTPGIKRVVLIDGAECLTREAQNALLKTLEEIPDDTAFILTTPNTKSILQTVVSRCIQLAALPVPLDSVYDFFNKNDRKAVEKAFRIANGRVGLLCSILNNQSHLLIEAIEFVKQLFSQSEYERMLLINSISKDKLKINDTLEAIVLLSRASMKVSIGKHNEANTRRWLNLVKKGTELQFAITKNANPKLILTDMFINI